MGLLCKNRIFYGFKSTQSILKKIKSSLTVVKGTHVMGNDEFKYLQIFDASFMIVLIFVGTK